MLPLLFISASQQKPYRVLSIPCRCNRRTCHCLSHPQQCLSKAIFHLLHTYPSHHTGFLCNAVCTCTLFFHEFSYVKILSYFKGFVKGKGRKTAGIPAVSHNHTNILIFSYTTVHLLPHKQHLYIQLYPYNLSQVLP